MVSLTALALTNAPRNCVLRDARKPCVRESVVLARFQTTTCSHSFVQTTVGKCAYRTICTRYREIFPLASSALADPPFHFRCKVLHKPRAHESVTMTHFQTATVEQMSARKGAWAHFFGNLHAMQQQFPRSRLWCSQML